MYKRQALSAVKRRGLKSTELNSLKQIGYAWQLYANHNNDAALPGYLDAAVQEATQPGVQSGWDVNYEYPDKSIIPNTPANIPGPWPWRLLSYLDYNHSMIHGHLDEEGDPFAMQAEGQEIAEEPGFGYNGLYVGGYWTIVAGSGGDPVARPRYRFHDHEGVLDGRALTVPLAVSQVNRSSEMVMFCSSTKVTAGGNAFFSASKAPPDTAGWHLVTPPTVGTEVQWEPYQQDPLNAAAIPATASTFPDGVYIPYGRYTGVAALMYADGHTANEGYNALNDQRKWINSADVRNYTHQPAAGP